MAESITNRITIEISIPAPLLTHLSDPRHHRPWLINGGAADAKAACPDSVYCFFWLLDKVDGSGKITLRLDELARGWQRACGFSSNSFKPARRLGALVRGRLIQFVARLDDQVVDLWAVLDQQKRLRQQVRQQNQTEPTQTIPDLICSKPVQNFSEIDSDSIQNDSRLVSDAFQNEFRTRSESFRIAETPVALLDTNINKLPRDPDDLYSLEREDGSISDSPKDLNCSADAEPPPVFFEKNIPEEPDPPESKKYSAATRALVTQLREALQKSGQTFFDGDWRLTSLAVCQSMLDKGASPAELREAIAWAVAEWDLRAQVSHFAAMKKAFVHWQRHQAKTKAEAALTLKPKPTAFEKLQQARRLYYATDSPYGAEEFDPRADLEWIPSPRPGVPDRVVVKSDGGELEWKFLREVKISEEFAE